MAKKIPISDELRRAALKLWFMLMHESGRMVPLITEEEPFTESELDAVLSHLNYIARELITNRPTKNRWRDSAIATQVDNRIIGGANPQQAYEDVADYMQDFGPTLSANYIGKIYRNWKNNPNARRGKIELIDKDT